MGRQTYRNLRMVVALVAIALLTSTVVQANDLERHIWDQYRGKILVLRGFYSGEKLRYDASGALSGEGSVGDWTTDGFVQLDEIYSSGQNLKIKAKRLMVISAGQTGFRFSEEKALLKHKKLKKAALVDIYAPLGTESVTEAMVNAILSRIFISSEEQLVDFVPKFWEPCVEEGISGRNEACRFSSEMIAVPGVSAPVHATTSSEEQQTSVSPPTSSNTPETNIAGLFKVGNGVKPPKVIFQPEPSFSESARKAKYQGMTTMGLIVDKDGLPKNIHIVRPLGAGLDARAVQAVETWKFQPAQKDGQPVAVAIAVEVEFHLY
ncbi:MAG: energy transducer TonB [Acidobacteriia bacterium]|nr:energy transducer TonB [Terriglobia bacterium]